MKTIIETQNLREAITLAEMSLVEAETVRQEHLTAAPKKVVVIYVNHLRELVEAAKLELNGTLQGVRRRTICGN